MVDEGGHLYVRFIIAGSTILEFETSAAGASVRHGGPFEALLNSLPFRAGGDPLLEGPNEIMIGEGHLRVWLVREAGLPQMSFQWIKLQI
jgi:hypothetical protein